MAKYRTTVGTSVSRVIEDEWVPNSVKSGVTRSLLQNNDLVDSVLEEMINSIGIRAERLYDYAKDGDYTWGLPSGQFTTGEAGRDTVDQVLETIEGAAVVIDYAQHGPPNNLHIGWQELIATHGYDPATNQLGGLTTSLGTTVWLVDMQVVIPSSESGNMSLPSLAQWGIAARAGYTPQRAAGSITAYSPVQIDTVETTEYLKVTHTRQVLGLPVIGSFTIPVTGYDDQKNYFHARYVVGGVAKYWMYEDGAGTYPLLDALFDRDPEPNGSFFPFLYYRYEKASEVDNQTTEAYRTSKRLARYLGMNYNQVGEGINSNPDIADVEQAMVMFAVPANTTNEMERRYLFKFFDTVFYANPVDQRFETEAEAQAYAATTGIDLLYVASPTIVIQDTRFKMTLDNDGVYKTLVVGSIGDIGTYDSGFTTGTRTLEVIDISTGIPETITSPAEYHYFRKQVLANSYEEIQVVNLRTEFHIFGVYTTIGDDLDKILLIPLDHTITSDYTIMEREELYSRSLHYVFNSVVVTKVKWYETGIFKIIMIVVMIVITIYTMGAGLSAMLGLLAAGEFAAAALLVIEAIIQFVVVNIAFRLFVKVVGVKFAFVLAIVAAVAGVVNMIDAGSLSGIPFADELLQVSSGLSKAIDAQVATDVKDLVSQAKEFETYKTEQEKLLESGKDLLSNSIHLSPFVIFGESPEDFYNRTVHSGNIGVSGGIDSISAFVDTRLTLPKLSESLNEG